MKITTINTVLGNLNVLHATTFLFRLKGLLLTKGLEKDTCLLISPCASVHTIGMLYPINIIFLDKDNFVLAIKNQVKPNRICLAPAKTKRVVELSSKWGNIQPHIIGRKFMEDIL